MSNIEIGLIIGLLVLQTIWIGMLLWNVERINHHLTQQKENSDED